jgi:predicted transcriptional regulator
MITKQQDILKSSVNELRFALLQILHLKQILQEVETMTTDNLAKGVIKNGLERHEMDKLIHTRALFK